MMWELYEELISDMDESVTMEEWIIGPRWAAVRSSLGGVGIAPVITEIRDRFEFSFQPDVGMPLKEIAQHMVSWNYFEASLGLAACNAFYNDPKRMEALGKNLPGGRRNRKVLSKFCEEHTASGKTVLAEPDYDSDTLSEMPGVMDVIRKENEFRDYIPAAWSILIPEADRLVLSGRTLVEKTAEKMIGTAVENETEVFLFGAGVPLSQGLQKLGIREIWGFVFDDADAAMKLARAGISREKMFQVGHYAVLA